MSRRSIIISLIALAVMSLGIGIAVLCLYSDVELPRSVKKSHAAADDRGVVFSAVPSDAIFAACFSDAEKVAPQLIDGLEWPQDMRNGLMAVSLHYSGRLFPLYVFEMKSDGQQAEPFGKMLEDEGMHVMSMGGVLIASPSETVLNSSARHIDKGVSIMDASGFDRALASVSSEAAVFISNAHMNRLLPAVVKGKYVRHSDFFKRLADWTVFDMTASSGHLALDGRALYEGDATEFMTVLENSAPAVSAVSSVLPSYTLFALSLPMKNAQPYISAYQSYLDTRQRLQANQNARNNLKAEYGVSPEDMVASLGVREVAAAFFMKGNSIEKITLVRTGRDAHYVDTVNYASVFPVVFGDFFACNGESVSVFLDGWIISGSASVIEQYKEGKMTDYSLKDLMDDAGDSDPLADRTSSAVAYFSFSEEKEAMKNIFASSFTDRFSSLYEDAEVAPAVLSVAKDKDGMNIVFDLMNLSVETANEALFEGDTTVVVPKGPFKVKNSGTGKMNEFYQNSHKSLCLREEGKDLWGIPFDKLICGRAGTVDFYANGKLQILFGAGRHIHLLDRLGRYVTGFPLDLGKDILLGPDIYDFSGKRKYNIMVLHKDNTIEMYNLQGARPSSWKGITVPEGEVIKNLPERIDLSGSTFWVVRTSVQTLIYPFYGGEPLTKLEGNQKIRPDSEIKKVDGTTVEYTCYDSKVRTLPLK